jgi:bifunctional NMN adenylyltransferase/nudix hydrolase
MKNVRNGVIVARFQVPNLLDEHKKFLNYVLSQGHKNNIIILGVPATKATKSNPLDFDSRRKMLEEIYPKQFRIAYLKDENDDKVWSEKLDKMIDDIICYTSCGDSSVVIYGSYDSVVKHYCGKHKTEIYTSEIIQSETNARFYTGSKVQNSSEWRAGAVWSAQQQYDKVYPTVDCVIFTDNTFSKIWMAKKASETKLRFVGGFADPKDNSFEETAIRETKEETNLICNIVSYIGSTKIDDWRYRNEYDKIITSIFALIPIENQKPTAMDDISELHMVELSKVDSEFIKNNIQSEHHSIMVKVLDFVKSINKN